MFVWQTKAAGGNRPYLLTIQLLRPDEWVESQLSYVVQEREGVETVGSLFPDSDGSATEQKEVASAATQAEQNLQEKDSRPSTGYVVDAPLSPPRPVFRDILFTSLAAEEAGVELIGMTVQMDLPELGLTGEAIVTDIQACSEIEPRAGNGDDRRVVTATFNHSSGDVIDLVLADELSDLTTPDLNPETQTPKPVGEADIGTTSNHPFWSVDRQEYVQAEQLQVGERLQTLHGDTKTVVSNLPRPGPKTDVYNLEVHAEHVYFVGKDGVLVHNACDTNKMGSIGEHAAIDAMAERGWSHIGTVSRGRNGIDLVMQKTIRGKLKTLIVESKVNSSRLPKLQKKGAHAYAEDVLRRFEGSAKAGKLNGTSPANYSILQEMIEKKETIRGVVVRTDWRSGAVKQSISIWRKK